MLLDGCSWCSVNRVVVSELQSPERSAAGQHCIHWTHSSRVATDHTDIETHQGQNHHHHAESVTTMTMMNDNNQHPPPTPPPVNHIQSGLTGIPELEFPEISQECGSREHREVRWMELVALMVPLHTDTDGPVITYSDHVAHPSTELLTMITYHIRAHAAYRPSNGTNTQSSDDAERDEQQMK